MGRAAAEMPFGHLEAAFALAAKAGTVPTDVMSVNPNSP